MQTCPQACAAELHAEHQTLRRPSCLISRSAKLLKRVHNCIARTQAQCSSQCSASACSAELLERGDELQRQSDEQQRARRMYCPRGLGSPEQLQDLVRGVTLEQIHVVMQALEKEHECL